MLFFDHNHQQMTSLNFLLSKIDRKIKFGLYLLLGLSKIITNVVAQITGLYIIGFQAIIDNLAKSKAFTAVHVKVAL